MTTTAAQSRAVWTRAFPAGHPVAASRELNHRLSTTDLPLEHAGTYARPVEADDDVLAAVLAEHHARGSHPFDGPLVSCASDLLDGPVRWATASYFDLLVTNLAPDQVRRPDGTVYRPADHAGSLVDSFGVAGMALTSDGWWVLCKASATSIRCGGQLAPSGAGAMELGDMLGASGLAAAAARTAWRELTEECGLPATATGTTYVTGLTRDLAAGGKPDMSFLTLLDVPAEAIGTATPDDYTDGHVLVRCEGDPVTGARQLLAGLPDNCAWSVTQSLVALLAADWLHPALTAPVPLEEIA